MKKLFAMILSVLLLCGVVTPAFAEDVEPDKPELVAVKIDSVPLKNRVVFLNGDPETPEGIQVKLHYQDGTTIQAVIEATERGYYADQELVNMPSRAQVIRYGMMSTELLFREDSVKATYKYLSLPNWLSFLSILFR